jgi:hypothetical protein
LAAAGGAGVGARDGAGVAGAADDATAGLGVGRGGGANHIWYRARASSERATAIRRRRSSIDQGTGS